MAKGMVYFQRKDFAMALDMLENAVPENRENPVLWKHLGAARFANRQFDKAAEAYARAIELTPADADNYINLAESCTYDFQNDNALKWYQAFEKKRPDIGDTHLNLGYLYAYRVKDREKVEFHWLKYLAMEPQAPQKEKILAYLKRLKEMNPDELARWTRDVEVDPRKVPPVVVRDGGATTEGDKTGTGGMIRPATPRDLEELNKSSTAAEKARVEREKPQAVFDGVDDGTNAIR